MVSLFSNQALCFSISEMMDRFFIEDHPLFSITKLPPLLITSRTNFYSFSTVLFLVLEVAEGFKLLHFEVIASDYVGV